MLKVMLSLFFIFLYANASNAILSLTEQEQKFLKQKDFYKLCVDPQSYPFEEITTEGVYRGITADLVEKVARRLGIALEVQQVLTWDDSLKLAKSGQCDILTFITPSEETHKWLSFSDPLFSDPNVFITREEHPYIEDISTLVHESIVIPIVSDLFTRFSKEFENLVVIPVATKEEALNMVSNHKADMTIRSMIAAAYTIKKERLFNLKVAGEPEGYANVIHLSIMNDKPMFLSLLNKAIATITPEEKELSVNQHIAIVIEKGFNKEVIKYFTFGLVFLALIFMGIILWNALLRKKVAHEVEKNSAIQNKLFQASKEAEIGRIIANISHQWRGTLAKIGALNLYTLVQLKKEQPLDKALLTQQSEEIGKLLDFMSQTMQDFLEFYKPSKKIETFTLIQTLHHAISFLETKIANSSLKITYSGQTNLQLSGIKNHWVHIWLNLIDNTINAAMRRHITEPYFAITISQAEIIIHDNAGGIDPETSIMGLGIQMCQDLAKEHHATFSYKNTDVGLCARITFLN
ncbi:MAG: transporter substrate-binding domain-containing protein [Sulfurospirillaceae bacterium]|jgi:polar amino acid transport system substrate-binding protein|nr:transporter substrate-binding domain-containing protein [Sulfurospirillaceae bacterium]MDD2827925.1 transporter substrate-binding domain-containing protein [Sulfurospirillaceae bacterium]